MSKVKPSEMVGKKARVTREIELRSGRVVPVGTIVIIGSTWRGRFTLDSTKAPRKGFSRECVARHISRFCFEVIE